MSKFENIRECVTIETVIIQVMTFRCIIYSITIQGSRTKNQIYLGDI